MTTFLAVVGAVTPPGRLNAAISTAVEMARAHPGVDAAMLSLADHHVSFADGRPLEQFTDDTAAVVARIVASDVVLLATPVYRATFTGALKNLLDLVPLEGLRDKPVGIVAMGATLHHYLGADWHLRAVLGWFGAVVAPTSVYLESAHFREGRLADETARRAVSDLVETLLALRRSVKGPLGPPPLAAQRA
jgi:FMN reductase